MKKLALLSAAVFAGTVFAEGTNDVDSVASATVETAAVTNAAATVAVTNATATAAVEKAPITTRLFKLNHASAVEVAERFNQMWNGEFGQIWKVTKMAVAFEEPNTVMITAPEPIIDACDKAIAELDVESPQVYIEARFVELGNTASHKVGIDWTMLGGMTGTVNLGGGVEGVRIGDAVANYTRLDNRTQGITTSYEVGKTWDSASGRYVGDNGKDGGITHFTGILDFSQMAMTLKALDSTGDTKTFSNPKIIVASGRKAIVDMTTKYPNVQIAAKKTINNNNESVDLDMKMADIPGEDKMMFAKEAFFSWGIELTVTPRVSTNGLINVTIVPTISECSDFVTAGTDSGSSASAAAYSAKYPIIGVKRLVTEFSMASGTTAVIGGLSKTVETQVDTGIPVLRDIPWLGPRIFGSTERVKEQREIIVFVTVGLVNPREIQPDAGLPKNAVLGRQYTKGQKLEPGDRPEKNMEGFESLDMRSLEEQAKDPLQLKTKSGFSFGDYIPFTKDPNYKHKKQ